MRASRCLPSCLVLFCLAAALPAAPQPEKAPAPPSDAQWTIRCRSFSGPDRVMEAMRTRDFLRKQTGEKTWYLLHGETDTVLFYGYYRSVLPGDAAEGKDRKDAERAQADRLRIAALRDERGQPAFAEAYFVPADAVGEDGPSEWNIAKAGPAFQWTLLIGVYEQTPDRKRVAVDAVKKLRGEKVEAYYYHGDAQSFVFVGCWEASAIIRNEVDTSRLSQSPDEEVMVIERDLDPSVPTVYRDVKKDGTTKIVRLAPRTTTIQDQNVKEMQAKFPHFHTNGQVMGKRIKDPKTQEERIVYDQSVLVSIPRRPLTVVSGDRPSAPPSVQLIKPPGQAPKPAGSGKLKSLDD